MSPLSLLLRGLIRAYQMFLSPVLTRSCRFQPTCSAYALEAIAVHGAIVGSGLALRRLLRCHPWGGEGYDPVPPRRTATARIGAGHRFARHRFACSHREPSL